jgi:hypothetical protein
MINSLPPRTPSDAKVMTDDKIKNYIYLCVLLATFAVNVFLQD